MFLGPLFQKTKPLLSRSISRFGSYYQTVKLFSEVQQTPGNKNKLTKIRQFKSSLSEPQKKQFFNLLQWYSRKEPVRVSSKIITKYHLSQDTSQPIYADGQWAEGGVMKRLCRQDKQSELSLFDVNLFLRYITAMQGTGSQTEKIKMIIGFGENVSVLEGIFLLKLIEKKLTIGASKKTFRKLDQKLAKDQQNEDQQNIQIPAKLTKTGKPKTVKSESPQPITQSILASGSLSDVTQQSKTTKTAINQQNLGVKTQSNKHQAGHQQGKTDIK